MFFKNEPAMPVTSFPLPSLPLNRRDVLIGGAGAAAGLLLPSLAGAQTKLQVTEGNVAPLPIAIPNFVAGAPGGGEGRGRGAPVTPNNPKRSRRVSPRAQAPSIGQIVSISSSPQIPSRTTSN